MSDDHAPFAAWIGRQQVVQDVITQAPVSGLSAALDYASPRAQSGSALPPCWHWLYFLEPAKASAIGEDGHARRGNFLPPVELPRRMWAGSRLRFHAPLCVGDRARRISTIAAIEHKRGRSGELVFVTVHHAVFRASECLIEEEQDLVFRAAAVSQSNPDGSSTPAPMRAADSARIVRPDPVLLFRYSALTFNSHRIHYDRQYAMSKEGYAGLVVHGPLTATLLLDLMHRDGITDDIDTFEFRGLSPLTDATAMRLCSSADGQRVALWAEHEDGALAVEARAVLLQSQ